MTRWDDVRTGTPRSGADYAARWERLAASGAQVHGEAAFVARLVPPGARVLDAGCGTGRVAIRLAELGYVCTGVDVDAAMLDHARTLAPDLPWVLADLAGPDLPAGPFDVVVAAGNVIPLLAAGTEAAVVAALAARAPVVVAGFGLDAAHLPLAEAPFGLAEYDAWCAAAGLVLAARHATWDGDPYEGGGYAVSVHTPATGLPESGERLQ